MRSIISRFEAVWLVRHAKAILFPQKKNIMWFSKKQIEDLYNELKNNDFSGVRIYEGKYPNHEKFSRMFGKYDYRNKSTLVFIPTIQKEDIHEDEIPEEEVKDIVRKIIKGEIPPDFRPFNHGELCPPNCGGDIVDDNT